MQCWGLNQEPQTRKFCSVPVDPCLRRRTWSFRCFPCFVTRVWRRQLLQLFWFCFLVTEFKASWWEGMIRPILKQMRCLVCKRRCAWTETQTTGSDNILVLPRGGCLAAPYLCESRWWRPRNHHLTVLSSIDFLYGYYGPGKASGVSSIPVPWEIPMKLVCVMAFFMFIILSSCLMFIS